MKLARWFANRHVRSLIASATNDVGRDQYVYQIRDELERVAIAELESICRRAPKGLRSPSAYVAKALKVRCLGRGKGGAFGRILNGNRWMARQRRDVLRQRLVEVRRKYWTARTPAARRIYETALTQWQKTYDDERSGLWPDQLPEQWDQRRVDWAAYHRGEGWRKVPKHGGADAEDDRDDA